MDFMDLINGVALFEVLAPLVLILGALALLARRTRSL